MYYETGSAYREAGSLIQAYAAYEFAIATYEKHKIEANYSYCLGYYALLGIDLDREASIRRLGEAVSMALLYDDSRSTIFHAGRLALIYAEGNDADKAIACNRRALEIALKYGDKAGQIASRGSLG